MYTYSIIITRNGQEIKKFLDFLPVLSIYFSIECQLLLEVKTILITMYSDSITAAGSNFAGMGILAIPAVLVYGFVRTGLSEELFFRGFLLKRVSSKWGFAIGNTVQAILFGAVHGIPFGIATHNIFVTIMLTLLPGMLGWYQGWLNEKRCGESIIPSWLLHGTINAIVACLSL